MVTSFTPSALVVVTTELVSQPAVIARLKEEFSGYELHQQLLERLEEDAVQLPNSKYSRVHVAGGTLSGHVCDRIFASMKNESEITGNLADSRPVLTIAGFVQQDTDRWTKKELGQAPVQLKKRSGTAAATDGPVKPLRRFAKVSDQLQPTEKHEHKVPLTPPGDEDIIDEDELVEGHDIKPAIVFPEKCDPGPGKKRRRACKDCTCGLKEQEEQEQDSLESSRAVLLDQNDMAEIDFTVPGKAVGGCGSCALGDAFRCDGCPYIGLPPFKPGQVVSLDQYGDDF